MALCFEDLRSLLPLAHLKEMHLVQKYDYLEELSGMKNVGVPRGEKVLNMDLILSGITLKLFPSCLQ